MGWSKGCKLSFSLFAPLIFVCNGTFRNFLTNNKICKRNSDYWIFPLFFSLPNKSNFSSKLGKNSNENFRKFHPIHSMASNMKEEKINLAFPIPCCYVNPSSQVRNLELLNLNDYRNITENSWTKKIEFHRLVSFHIIRFCLFLYYSLRIR